MFYRKGLYGVRPLISVLIAMISRVLKCYRVGGLNTKKKKEKRLGVMKKRIE
jgi:hypothetical protein